MSLDLFHPVISRWWREKFACVPPSPAADGDSPTYAPPTDAQLRGWEAIRSGRHALIAAPTGSGKTLAAFLEAIDALLRAGLEKPLPDETRVLYVSPLKALTADIHRNLAEPRREIRRLAGEMGLPEVRITAAMRTGDTPASERAAMLRMPPHILVTTPESLYLLLTAEKSREMLRTVRTVVVDEIHAVIESRRGAHLSLSLERLEHVVGRPVQRIGLSATQKPIEQVARFLTGERPACEDAVIVDAGHMRDVDLALELPGSSLEAVMSAEAWQEVFDRLAALIRAHRTTLVFVNTRRLAERVARALSERLGEAAVTAHHGSLSKDVRLDAEDRLKEGRLKALVATASLELGIDIGHVNLVCQLGSTRRIATFLQRVGRSGHTVRGRPKGRLFPLSRDDLVECVALLRAVRDGELDRIIMPEQPLDILAQQVIAEAACEDWAEDELFALAKRAYPYRALDRARFDDIVGMVSRGFTTRRGRRSALVHHDAVNHRLRGRRAARLAAITSGGAIPEIADYRVELEPEGTFIGTLNEDFAIESMAGDIFQLGNSSWRILQVAGGVVRVADAHGVPPTIPFWLGEAPARSDELSAGVSALREHVGSRMREQGESDPAALTSTVARELGVGDTAASQILDYFAGTLELLGVLPSQRTLVLERFFDEAGGMQLVLHAPFGSRVNRAWGLSLRKKFCRTFNFELQAAATDEGLLLSLGPQHSFPLDEVFRYLNPATLEETLVQAVLDSPLFQTRWRWASTLSLAVQRSRAGGRIPPPIQRMQAEDLLAAVFPDAAACLENVAGDREVPDHPLVSQSLRDCLEEAMDLPQLVRIVADVLGGRIECVARDTPEPSPFCHELLNARPYAFLDDAPLEERRTQAVYSRRALEPSSAADLGALDRAAIDRVREEAWPEADSADEMHDALLMCGFLLDHEAARGGAQWARFLDELCGAGRATHVTSSAGQGFWIAVERVRELRAVLPDAMAAPALDPPPGHDREWSRENGLRELVKSRLEVLGPVTTAAVAVPFGIDAGEVEIALVAIEAEGFVLRGSFTPGETTREWCDRRLLARIHRYTLNRLRAEIQPVTPADFMRFLFRWQRVAPGHRVSGVEGLSEALEALDGFELPAAAWESDVLPARCDAYGPELLDSLCLSGRTTWGRLSRPTPSATAAAEGRAKGRTIGPLRTSPIALSSRRNVGHWMSLAPRGASTLGGTAAAVHNALERCGASFFDEIVGETGLPPERVERGLAILAAAGYATADGFGGLRALLARRRKRGGTRGSGRNAPTGIAAAGRWTALPAPPADEAVRPGAQAIEAMARTLLRRYGIVFRKLLARETLAPSWRELVLAYRRLEARGEVRGGRFVSGFTGEQFALPEAVGLVRAVRREEKTDEVVAIGAADPLNLVGIVTPGERIPSVASTRVVWRGGVPVAVLESRELRLLTRDADENEIRRALLRGRTPPALRDYLKPKRAGRRRIQRAGAAGD